jgi:hypothetical protein
MSICKLLMVLLAMSGMCRADSVSFTGTFQDPNQVFEDSFSLSQTSNLVAQSYGYGGSAGAPGGTNAAGTVIAAGGFDSYLSLFSGAGPTATFLVSNDDGGCGPASPDPVCEDSQLNLNGLAAGTYTLVLTLPNNYSIAENYGYGTLGDGFIDLQGDFYDDASGEERTGNYALDITSNTTLGAPALPPAAATPEPSSLALLASGLLFGAAKLGRNRRRNAATQIFMET